MDNKITDSKQRRFNGFWLGIAFVSLVVLLVLTHWPPEKIPIDINRFGLDKLVHMAVYAGLAWLFFKALPPGQTYLSWVGLIGGLLVIAVLDEITQTYVNRQFDLFDIAADAMGILGCFIILYSRKYSFKKQR